MNKINKQAKQQQRHRNVGQTDSSQREWEGDHGGKKGKGLIQEHV